MDNVRCRRESQFVATHSCHRKARRGETPPPQQYQRSTPLRVGRDADEELKNWHRRPEQRQPKRLDYAEAMVKRAAPLLRRNRRAIAARASIFFATTARREKKA